MNRILYLLAMYSGLRAVLNRVRSYCLPQPRASLLDRQVLLLDKACCVEIRVHARSHSQMKGKERIPGMVSISLASPGIHPIAYALWKLTSHFGCGHIELAFFEERGVVHFYAVRNILKSNMERLGGNRLSRRLKFAQESDEIFFLQQVMKRLADHGLPAIFESPEICVDLAVSPSLLHPQKHQRSIQALLCKYRRISKRVGSNP